MKSYRIVPAGDSTLLVQFEDRIDPLVNARAIGLAAALETAAIPGVRDVVPTYRSVAICFEPLKTDIGGLLDRVAREAEARSEVGEGSPAPVLVPVCYGGDEGPDLLDVARLASMTPEQVIAVHAAATYRVFMFGFLPGFAYMGTVDRRIAIPRQSSPRLRVPKGSVGIAGQQTGIYPSAAPGGWRLIGRTPIELFDAGRSHFLFKPGDHVRFVPVDRAEFERLGG